MSENTESYLKEIEEGRIISNVHLLELKLVRGSDPDNKERDLPAIKSKLVNIKQRETYFSEDGSVRSPIEIDYDTKTGEIGIPDTARFPGDYSAIVSELVEKDGKLTILLYRPGDFPSAAQYSSAIVGELLHVPAGNRRIYPQRKFLEDRRAPGIEEDWGQSKVVDNTDGDLIMLKSIRKFNEKYGPKR